jgi:multiple sugar transport system substrate-binding protein
MTIKDAYSFVDKNLQEEREMEKHHVITKAIALAVALLMVLGMMPASLAEGSTVSTEGKVIIPFWHDASGEAATLAWWTKWVNAFNEQSKTIYVDLQAVPDDAREAKLKAAQATGTAPQILYVNYATAIAQADQGLYMPLDDLIDPTLWEDVYDSVEEMCSAGGKHYLVPHHVEPYSLLFYRKDMFEAAGLDPNAPPKSWAELKDYAQKLTKDGVFGIGIAGENDYGWTNWGWEAMLGKNLIDETWSKPLVQDQEFKDLIQLYKDLIDSGSTPAQQLDAFWNVQPLAEGRLAMQLNGSWAITRLKNPDDLGKICPPENIGVALCPTPDGVQEGRSTGALGGWALAIDGMAQNPKECAEFLTWLLLKDPQIMAEFFVGGNFSKYTARKSVDEVIMATDAAKNDPWLKVIAEGLIPYAGMEPIYPWDISASFATAMGSVLTAGMTIDDALAISAEEIQAVINDQGLAGKNPRQK